jgi:acetyltransferase-like isoleucine patch superfamily enzyme
MKTVNSRFVFSRTLKMCRVAYALLSLVVVESMVCGISAAPAVATSYWLLQFPGSDPVLRVVLLSFVLVPSYVLFALCLMIVSPVITRLLGWGTPPDAEMRIADMDWTFLRWARYGASIHLVRMLAGSLFRGTPLWTVHLRLSGARLGRRVYVNSLSVSDYNLIECGDDVVIGGAAHMSGHTVEAGIVKTARVKLGNNVTIGLGSVIEIGVEVGPDVQVGALSFVPKHTKLPGGAVYAGAPAAALS